LGNGQQEPGVLSNNNNNNNDSSMVVATKEDLDNDDTIPASVRAARFSRESAAYHHHLHHHLHQGRGFTIFELMAGKLGIGKVAKMFMRSRLGDFEPIGKIVIYVVIASRKEEKSINEPFRGRLHLRFESAVWMCLSPSQAF
jgi:hypothetical protein